MGCGGCGHKYQALARNTVKRSVANTRPVRIWKYRQKLAQPKSPDISSKQEQSASDSPDSTQPAPDEQKGA